MMNQHEVRVLLKEMESTAEQILQQDAAFFEALQALKWEVDSHPKVKSVVRDLRAAGHRVFNSFVPQIKVRVKTESGILALTNTRESSNASASEPVAKLTQELKNAASAVIMRSIRCQDLQKIVNEAIAENKKFEKIASQFETAGYEVMISIDLSAYTRVQASSTAAEYQSPMRIGNQRRLEAGEPPVIEFSAHDVDFLKTLKIKTD